MSDDKNADRCYVDINNLFQLFKLLSHLTSAQKQVVRCFFPSIITPHSAFLHAIDHVKQIDQRREVVHIGGHIVKGEV